MTICSGGGGLICDVGPSGLSAKSWLGAFFPWFQCDCDDLHCFRGGSASMGGSKMIPQVCSRCMPFWSSLTTCMVPFLVIRSVAG